MGTSAEIEAERRLLYVKMTRAKDVLSLVVPQRFFTHGQQSQGDRHVYASQTRFIPDRLLGLLEKITWPSAATGTAPGFPIQRPRIDVGARMRGCGGSRFEQPNCSAIVRCGPLGVSGSRSILADNPKRMDLSTSRLGVRRGVRQQRNRNQEEPIRYADKIRTVVPVLCQLTQVFMVCSGRNS
jgi:hypothetical protein